MIKNKRSVYWFFRSFAFTFIIVFCVFSLIIGCAKCYTIIENNITGKKIKIIEIKEDKVLILGEEILNR